MLIDARTAASARINSPHTSRYRGPQQARFWVVGVTSGFLSVGTWLSLVEHSLGVRGVGSSNLPVPTISFRSSNLQRTEKLKTNRCSTPRRSVSVERVLPEYLAMLVHSRPGCGERQLSS